MLRGASKTSCTGGFLVLLLGIQFDCICWVCECSFFSYLNRGEGLVSYCFDWVGFGGFGVFYFPIWLILLKIV